MLDDFETAEVNTGETVIFTRRSGSGPPLLLLHGFPETHVMWRGVAPLLASSFTVVCADLRGYGNSGCPASTPDHAPYTKRAMARDMVRVMQELGFPHFSLAGHDRGGRVAYRLALDYPERLQRVAVLDVVPTLDTWDRADHRFALGFWPWSFLAQPDPLPERLLSVAPDAVIDDALQTWGSAASAFPAETREAYINALRDPRRAHAICEEYRAAAALDRDIDASDRSAGRRIGCPMLVLWSSHGALADWYVDLGGPLGVWRAWAEDVRGDALDAGHFFPEEMPERTAAILTEFFQGR